MKFPLNSASALLVLAVISAGCASHSRAGAPDDYEPSKLKPDAEEVPQLVRAIESAIDKKSALVAREVEIYVSRNYEWDVSLTGDAVSPQTADGDEHWSVATGNPRATLRNLEIKAWDRIVFRKSGFDVEPFIKVTARGQAALATEEREGAPLRVQRADIIHIDNADIRLQHHGDAATGGSSAPAGPRRAVMRERP